MDMQCSYHEKRISLNKLNNDRSTAQAKVKLKKNGTTIDVTFHNCDFSKDDFDETGILISVTSGRFNKKVLGERFINYNNINASQYDFLQGIKNISDDNINNMFSQSSKLVDIVKLARGFVVDNLLPQEEEKKRLMEEKKATIKKRKEVFFSKTLNNTLNKFFKNNGR